MPEVRLVIPSLSWQIWREEGSSMKYPTSLSSRRLRNPFRSLFDWGVSNEEKGLGFACDRHGASLPTTFYRGVSIAAPAVDVFRWLCQMRVAPYSYDWLDNFGRQSPRQLLRGLTDLERGQVFMTGFSLIDFEAGRHLTIRSRDLKWWQAVFGDIVATYLVRPTSPNESRLLVKMRAGYPRNCLRPFMKLILPPGDTIMMRKQLLTFKTLAESEANKRHPSPALGRAVD